MAAHAPLSRLQRPAQLSLYTATSLGSVERNKHEKELDNAEELDAFAAQKVHELKHYDEALEKAEEVRAFVDSGKATKEEFIAALR